MVPYISVSDQRRIDSIYAQMDSRNDRYNTDFERRNAELATLKADLAALTASYLNLGSPTSQEVNAYVQSRDRLNRNIAAKQRQLDTLTDSFNQEMTRLVEQASAISDRAVENFARQAQVCDITPAQGSGPDEDNPLTSWYVCTLINAAGELITDQTTDQTAVGLSIQEYRRVSTPEPQPEQPTRPVPPLDEGQYYSEDFCEFFEDECREVRRGHYSYWVSTTPPPPEPRFSGSRRYDTDEECIAIHGQCHSQETEKTANAADNGFENSKSTYVPSSYGNYEYLSAETCEQYHRSCEVVLAPGGGNQKFYVPTITGRVYVGGNDFPATSSTRVSTDQESMECAQNHGGCHQYKRDGNGDGDFNDPEDYVTYVPFSDTPVVITHTTYNNDGTVREREQVTVPHSDSRAPAREAPDYTPDPEPQIPRRAVDVDGTGAPTAYATGSACLSAGAQLCGQGNDGNWYRLPNR